MNRLLKSLGFEKKMIYFVGGMALVIIFIIFMLIGNNIRKNNNIKIDTLVETTNLYSNTIAAPINNIVTAIEVTNDRIGELYSNNSLKKSDAVSFLRNLVNKYDIIQGAFLYLDDGESITTEKSLTENDDDNDSDNEDDKKVSSYRSTNKNESVQVMVYNAGTSYKTTDLTRIRDSKDDVMNDFDRIYKINYATTFQTGLPQVTPPIDAIYGESVVKTITYSYPLKIEGFTKGIIGIDIDFEKFNELIDNTINYSNDFTYSIVASDELIIASKNENIISKKYSSIYNDSIKNFIDRGIKMQDTSYEKTATKLYVITPIIVSENKFATLLMEYNLNDVFVSDFALSFGVAIAIGLVFIIFCFSIWHIITKSVNDKFNMMYKKFAENVTEDVTKNIKGSLDEFNSKIKKFEQATIEKPNTKTKEEKDKELDDMLAKVAGEVLIDDKKDEKTGAKEVNEVIVEETNEEVNAVLTETIEKLSKEEVIEEPKEEVNAEENVVTEVVEEASKEEVMEETKEEANAEESVVTEVVEETSKEEIKEETKEEANAEESVVTEVVEETSKEEIKEETKDEPIDRPLTPQEIVEGKGIHREEKSLPTSEEDIQESKKDDIDDISANKSGVVENSEEIDEVAKKLEEVVLNGGELETTVSNEDIDDLVNKINTKEE